MNDTTASPAGVSAGDVARAMGVNKSTVGRWIAQGRIAAERGEWGYIIPATELDRLIAERAAKQT